MKKMLNLFAIATLVFSLFAPIATSAAGVNITPQVSNLSGAKVYTTNAAANQGDTILVNVKIDNQMSTAMTGVTARAVLPSGLEYVNGSARYYSRATGATTDTVSAVADALIAQNGVILPGQAAGAYTFLAYNVRVAANAAAGTYAPSTMVYANNGAVNVSTNAARIQVAQAAATQTPTQPITGVVAATSAATITSNVMNSTRNETVFSNLSQVKRGDEVFYRVTITNTGTLPLKDASFKAILPSGLEYVPGYAKYYYKENGVDKKSTVNDAIVSQNGVILPTIPVNNYVYVTYKVKVSANAAAGGPYAVSNNYYANSGAVNVSDNTGRLNVVVDGVTPTPTSSATISSTLLNDTRKESVFSTLSQAKRGDELFYRVTITNTGTSVLKDASFKAILPSGLEYVPGFAKYYYVENGVTKKSTVNDAIIAQNGVILPNVPVNNYVYVTFKVRVAANAAAGGPYAVSNNYYANNGAVNISDNNGRIMVNVDGVIPVPLPECNIDPSVCPVPVDPNPTPVVTSAMNIYASAYNKSAGSSDYKSYITAKRGDTIHFRVTANNAGSKDLTNVQLASVLPANMEFVTGSAKFVRTPGNAEISPVGQTTKVGTLKPGQGVAVEFDATIKADTDSKVTAVSYKATVSADGISPKVSTVTINLGLAGAEKLPETGTPGTLWAIGLLALFLAIAGAIYSKETGLYQRAVSAIRR